MFNKGSLLKVIFGGMIGLVAATGVIYISFVKPWAPSDLSIGITANNTAFTYDNCAPIVQFFDRSTNEDDFRVYRRNLGASAFTVIQIVPPNPGKGKQISIADSPLPMGTYEYKVSAYNQYGESFSDIKQVNVNFPDCAKIPPISTAATPLNPIIVNLGILNDCSVRISYRDNSTNEQGFRIYRAFQPEGKIYWDDQVVVANLGPHAGIPGTYTDNTKLPEGIYHYRMSAYNQNGQSFSNFSEIEVPVICKPSVLALPTSPIASTKTSTPLTLPTLNKLSTEACTWEATTNLFLRKGPGVGVYDKLASVEAGKGFPIIGQSEDGKFWAVEVKPDTTGYITKSETYSKTNGDCSNVPTLKDPPPPVIEATPTKKSGGNPVASTPCPVGAVCP